MVNIKINDNEMYDYFEMLLHAENTPLKSDWKAKVLRSLWND